MDRATIKMFIDQCDGTGLAGAADCIENLAAEVERLRRQLALYRIAEENALQQEPVAHRLNRKMADGLWVGAWLCGGPSAELLLDVEGAPDKWQLECAYAAPVPAAEPAKESSNDR